MNWAVAIYMCVNRFNVLTSFFLLFLFVSLTVLFSPFQAVAFIYWWFWGHKTFRGPCPNLDAEDQTKTIKPLTDVVRPPTPELSQSPDRKEGMPAGT